MDPDTPSPSPAAAARAGEPAAVADPPAIRPAKAGRPVGDQLAERLLAGGHLTPAQLGLATRVHAKVKATRTFTSVLLEMKHVSEAQVRAALRSSPLDAPLEDLLAELGLVEPHELTLALALQRERPSTSLADVLVDNHFIGGTGATLGRRRSPGVERASRLDGTLLDAALLKRASLAVYRTHGFLRCATTAGAYCRLRGSDLSRSARGRAPCTSGKDLVTGIAGPLAMARRCTALKRERRRGRGPVVPSRRRRDRQPSPRGGHGRPASDIHRAGRERLRIRFRQDGVMMPHADVLLDQSARRGRTWRDGRRGHRRAAPPPGRAYPVRGHAGHGSTRVVRFTRRSTARRSMRLLNHRDTLLGIREIGMASRMLELLQRDALDVLSGVVIVTAPRGPARRRRSTRP
ncbi:MAG: hypothetical protein R2745_06425 [Vicinamibacterales bacterium]